jgi:hypothetical protein
LFFSHFYYIFNPLAPFVPMPKHALTAPNIPFYDDPARTYSAYKEWPRSPLLSSGA